MTLADAIRSSLNEAIKAKNEAKFDQAFDEMNPVQPLSWGWQAELTSLFVARHTSAFSNQQYSPRPSERQN